GAAAPRRRVAAGAPVPGDGRSRAVRAAGLAVPRAGADSSDDRGGWMRLTVLGCAGSFPGPDSPCSSYLVEADGFRLLIDFGPGSLSGLQRYIGLHAVDAILLSHL